MTDFVRVMPLLAFITCLIMLFIFGDNLAAYQSKNPITWANLYTAIFDWAAIQTGFVFGVYGFVIGSPTEFMKAIEGSKPFKRFKSGIITSLSVGFVLTIVSIPLLIFAPQPFGGSELVKLLLFLWFSLFVYALGSFFRTAYLFALMSRQKPAPGIGG